MIFFYLFHNIEEIGKGDRGDKSEESGTLKTIGEGEKMSKFGQNILKRIAAVVLAFGVAFTGLPYEGLYQVTTVQAATAATQNAAAENNLATNIQDGAILHAWCWKFSVIKDNMKDIAAAGFSTVQTSPANACNDSYPTMKLMGNDEINGTDGCWWWQYQPTDWKIGNYQLGTRDDFKAMCAEADKYGIKIIVDVIPNHVTPTLSKVSQDLYNAVGGKDNLFHANGFNPIQVWGNRLECTTGQMGGLPDVNTENPAFQAYFLNYLNDLIACGADGFRYDTAKHIGVPSDPTDPKSPKNNFWPVAIGEESVNGVSLSDKSVFTYGEVLQGDNVPEAEYAKYMRMTASSYGEKLRGAVQSGNFNVDNISGWLHATPGRLVTWVESHDTYCNAGVSADLTSEQIRLAYGVIGARKEGTPLFYSRPDGSSGKSNRWGKNVLGAKGNDEFKSKEVTEINFFRNAMAGKSEYLRNPNGDQKILQIDRGTEGTVIINLNNNNVHIDSDTKLANGTYTDQVSGRTFTVANGKISGDLDKRKVAVIYNKNVEKVDAVSETGSDEFKTDTLSVTLQAKNVTDASYTTSEGASGSFTDGTVITIGGKSQAGDTITVTVKGKNSKGTTIEKTITFKKIDQEAFWKLMDGSYDVYIKKPSGWGSTMYCYAYEGETSNNGKWPGVQMESLGEDVYGYNLPDGFDSASIIFNDNANQYPAAQQPGLAFTKGTSMAYVDGEWVKIEKNTDEIQIVSSLKTGSSFDSETATATITLKNAQKGTYSVDNGPVKSFTGSTEIVLGKGKIADSDVTLTVSASNDKDSKTETFTFTKKFNADKNGGYVTYTSENGANAAATSEALGGKYATNPSNQMGKNKTIKSAADFDDSMIIAQGVANDDPRIFRGSHEGPVYDTYALYGAWDDENIYLGWQFTNVTDVVEPAQGYPCSDNGKPTNGDIPQILAFNTGKGVTGDGTMDDGTKIWNLKIAYDTPIDAMMCFSSKSGVGKPSVFTTNAQGEFSYEKAYCTGFKAAGVSFTTEDGFIGKSMVGIKANGYQGYVPANLWDDSSDWVDFLNEGHKTSMDTFYTMTIPMSALNVTKDDIEQNGIGVMHITTFGESGTGSLPMDKSMVDNATEPYSADDSTTAEKEDIDTITVPLARLGANGGTGGSGGSVGSSSTTKGKMTVNFGADRSAPQATETRLKLKAVAAGGVGTYNYQFLVDGNEVQNGKTAEYAWTAAKGDHKLQVKVTDEAGHAVTVSKDYTAEGGQETPALAATLTATPSGSTTVGSQVKLTANAAGGSGNYQYKFVLCTEEGAWVKLQDYGTSNTCTWTPDKAGKYTLYAGVTDSKGTYKRAELPFEVKVKEGDLDASLTASPSGSVTVGKLVKLTANATGGSGIYQYKFVLCTEDGNWVQLQDYGTSNNYIWKPDKAGKYTLYVGVTDSKGTYKKEGIPFEVKEKPVEIKATLTAGSSNSATVGSQVKLTANATGGSGSFKYKFVICTEEGKWEQLQDYGTSNTYTWTANKAGKHTLYVGVTDSKGTYKRASLPFEVKAGEGGLEAALTSTVSGIITSGSQMKLTANAAGGSGEYTYKFVICTEDGVWEQLQAYGTSNTYTWTANKAGKHTLYVGVTDSKGNYRRAELPIEVKAKEGELDAILTATPSGSAAVGSQVKLTANATGGSGDYKYKFVICTEDGVWELLQDYGTASTYTWTPDTAGQHTLYIGVTDSKGNYRRIGLPFTVQ